MCQRVSPCPGASQRSVWVRSLAVSGLELGVDGTYPPSPSPPRRGGAAPAAGVSERHPCRSAAQPLACRVSFPIIWHPYPAPSTDRCSVLASVLQYPAQAMRETSRLDSRSGQLLPTSERGMVEAAYRAPNRISLLSRPANNGYTPFSSRVRGASPVTTDGGLNTTLTESRAARYSCLVIRSNLRSACVVADL